MRPDREGGKGGDGGRAADLGSAWALAVYCSKLSPPSSREVVSRACNGTPFAVLLICNLLIDIAIAHKAGACAPFTHLDPDA